jgi:Flp pilus assembly protein TadD
MLSCPVCRATNSQGPACRRCRADLSLLFQLEAQRDRLLTEARDLLRQGQLHRTLALLGRAQDLRRDEDVRPLRAICHLLRRDFTAAWRDYRQRKPPFSSPVQ